MKSQVLLTLWCNISGDAAEEIWSWSPVGVKGLTLSLPSSKRTFSQTFWRDMYKWGSDNFGSVKARLHMRFLMRFLMRFRVQNAPDPTLHECLFREASCGLERKVSHIIWRHPSFEFLPTWRYFVAALRDYKPVRGRLGQILCAKSHQNRTKIASKIACVNAPL